MLKRLENWLIEKTALGTGSFSVWSELYILILGYGLAIVILMCSISIAVAQWHCVFDLNNINKSLINVNTKVDTKSIDKKFEDITKTLDKRDKYLKENSHV